jgi:hypothetical protein
MIFKLKDSIVEALTTLGGTGTAAEVRQYIKSKYGKDWKNIDVIMNDLCEESTSTFFSPEDRVLKCIEKGRYSLKQTVGSIPPKTKRLIESEAVSNLKKYSHREAEELLQKKGQLSNILNGASKTNLSSKEDHDKLQHFFHENSWDIEVSLFPIINYRLDAFKAKTGIEIERSFIDAVHRSLFRGQWAYAKGKLDVLVFIVPTYKEPKFEQVKRDLQEFEDIIPYPVYLIGVEPF